MKNNFLINWHLIIIQSSGILIICRSRRSVLCQMCQVMTPRTSNFLLAFFLLLKPNFKFVGLIFCTFPSPHSISLFTHDSGVLLPITASPSQLESSFEWFYLAFAAGKEWRGTTTPQPQTEGKQSLAEASLSNIQLFCHFTTLYIK